MTQVRDGLYEVIRLLLKHKKGYRIQRTALYLTVIDEVGKPARISFDDEMTIYPYNCAADDFDGTKS